MHTFTENLYLNIIKCIIIYICDYNIDQNNRDYDYFFHNRAALMQCFHTIDYFTVHNVAFIISVYCICAIASNWFLILN